MNSPKDTASNLPRQGTMDFGVTATATGDSIFAVSSREIATYCEKRHHHVLRDIKKMLQDIGETRFGLADFKAEYLDAQGKLREEYLLPKDLVVTLITGYDANKRYKMVKRLEELEAHAAKPVALTGPQLMAAALVEANLTLEKHQAQIAAMRDDVAAHERLSKAEGSLCITDAAKTLGLRPKALFTLLQAMRWIYKRPGRGGWLGYQDKCQAGYLEHKTTVVTGKDGDDKISEQVRVTPKGLAKLAKRISKDGETHEPR